MRMLRTVGGSLRLAVGLAVCASVLLGGCATGERRVARESEDAGWERCDPTPRMGFFLICLRR